MSLTQASGHRAGGNPIAFYGGMTDFTSLLNMFVEANERAHISRITGKFTFQVALQAIGGDCPVFSMVLVSFQDSTPTWSTKYTTDYPLIRDVLSAIFAGDEYAYQVLADGVVPRSEIVYNHAVTPVFLQKAQASFSYVVPTELREAVLCSTEHVSAGSHHSVYLLSLVRFAGVPLTDVDVRTSGHLKLRVHVEDTSFSTFAGVVT